MQIAFGKCFESQATSLRLVPSNTSSRHRYTSVRAFSNFSSLLQAAWRFNTCTRLCFCRDIQGSLRKSCHNIHADFKSICFVFNVCLLSHASTWVKKKETAWDCFLECESQGMKAIWQTPWMLPLGGIGCGAVVATIPATGIFWTSFNHYPLLSFNWRTLHGKLCTARLHTSSIFFTLLWGQWKGHGFNSASALLSVLLPKSGKTLRTAVAICRNPRARSASKVAQFTSTTKRSILKTGSEEGGCTCVKTFCRQSSNRTIPGSFNLRYHGMTLSQPILEADKWKA